MAFSECISSHSEQECRFQLVQRCLALGEAEWDPLAHGCRLELTHSSQGLMSVSMATQL